MNRRRQLSLSIAGIALVASAAWASSSWRANEGPMANATVSFGAWMTTPPFDRHPTNTDRFRNHHEIVPNVVTIKAGGTVNFIIGGFHQINVFGNGKKPSDVNTSSLIAPTNQPAPPLINDSNRRIYRGLDPSTQPQDRVEVVHFEEPGTYLVICGVLPHFQEGMFGWVRVIP